MESGRRHIRGRRRRRRVERPGMEFEVGIEVGDKERLGPKDTVQTLRNLIESSAVLKVEKGRFNNDRLEFTFLINGAEKRIPITYEDPKAYDNTPQQLEKYKERSLQIATEMKYVFSNIK